MKLAPFALVLLSLASPQLWADTANEKAVLAANDRFYEALNVMFTGDVTPMLAVWSHADDVLYMGPMGGYETGWAAIEPIWKKQASLKLGGKVEPQQVELIVGENLAVVCDIEAGENTNAEGETVQVSIRATNVYRKEGGEWKMVSHHTDLLPYLIKMQ